MDDRVRAFHRAMIGFGVWAGATVAGVALIAAGEEELGVALLGGVPILAWLYASGKLWESRGYNPWLGVLAGILWPATFLVLLLPARTGTEPHQPGDPAREHGSDSAAKLVDDLAKPVEDEARPVASVEGGPNTLEKTKQHAPDQSPKDQSPHSSQPEEIQLVLRSLDHARLTCDSEAFRSIRRVIEHQVSSDPKPILAAIQSGTSVEEVVCHQVVNVASGLIASGRFHLHRNTSDLSEIGLHMLLLHDTFVDTMAQEGFIDKVRAEQKKQDLRRIIEAHSDEVIDSEPADGSDVNDRFADDDTGSPNDGEEDAVPTPVPPSQPTNRLALAILAGGVLLGVVMISGAWLNNHLKDTTAAQELEERTETVDRAESYWQNFEHEHGFDGRPLWSEANRIALEMWPEGPQVIQDTFTQMWFNDAVQAGWSPDELAMAWEIARPAHEQQRTEGPAPDHLLINASAMGNLELVRIALATGADVNAKGPLGSGALSEAAARGHDAIVRLLIAEGAEVDAQGQFGASPLYLAATMGQVSTVRLLLNAQANPNIQDGYGSTPLHEAAAGGHASIVRLLVAAHADVDVRERVARWTPLHSAAIEGHAEVVELLLEAGASRSIRDPQGRTPLDLADTEGHSTIVTLLQDSQR